MEKERDKICCTSVYGVTVPTVFSKETIRSAINYKPRKDDLFIVTYPKSGTTWMHHIVLLILRHGKLSEDPLDFFLGCPLLEMTGAEAAEDTIRPGAIKSHLPYRVMPNSKDAKYIYVCRDPKDCAVSFYYHMVGTPMSGFQNKTFDEFFEHFIIGDVPYGDFFDHVMEWYKRRNDPNVYIVTYEALSKDIRGEILKIAKFIGEEYERALLDDPKALEGVIYYSSFEYMKEATNDTMLKFVNGEVTPEFLGDRKVPAGLLKRMEKVRRAPPSAKATMQFLRKGIVGDWKNHFNPDQLKRIEEIQMEKTANSEVMNLWK